ncbi:ACT domain-containing protein [Anaerovorax odorimutans]|uniref:ACT domain-containing protein n=1 Tax=Anaerovorax odorimutans TaxID=109327 RepID=UPI000421BA82|nr:ACT domain-containing protein [Anaerovorax odorimutans]
MDLKIIESNFTICKVNNIKDINFDDEFVFIGKTDEEFSLVCNAKYVPQNTISREDGWKGFRIQGELDFSLIGILSKISDILAEHKIGIFVVSTFNTDYILVKEENLDKAVNILEKRGYCFIN